MNIRSEVGRDDSGVLALRRASGVLFRLARQAAVFRFRHRRDFEVSYNPKLQFTPIFFASFQDP